MRVAMMTREYPPEVYGGAGVHVTELVAQLRKLCQVDVHCQGAPRPGAFAYQPDAQLRGANPALSTLSTDLVMANAAAEATVVHTHTWYTGMAGHLASLLYDVPHVLTAHSLEPLRPWKAEQLGGGYRISSWVEQTAVNAADAVIAVSSGMREDVLRVYPTVDPNRVHVVRNGIDTDVWYPAERWNRRRASRCWPTSASTAAGPSSHSSGGSPGRRASPTCWRPHTISIPTCSWCCAPERPTHRKSPPK